MRLRTSIAAITFAAAAAAVVAYPYAQKDPPSTQAATAPTSNNITIAVETLIATPAEHLLGGESFNLSLLEVPTKNVANVSTYIPPNNCKEKLLKNLPVVIGELRDFIHFIKGVKKIRPDRYKKLETVTETFSLAVKALSDPSYPKLTGNNAVLMQSRIASIVLSYKNADLNKDCSQPIRNMLTGIIDQTPLLSARAH